MLRWGRSLWHGAKGDRLLLRRARLQRLRLLGRRHWRLCRMALLLEVCLQAARQQGFFGAGPAWALECGSPRQRCPRGARTGWSWSGRAGTRGSWSSRRGWRFASRRAWRSSPRRVLRGLVHHDVKVGHLTASGCVDGNSRATFVRFVVRAAISRRYPSLVQRPDGSGRQPVPWRALPSTGSRGCSAVMLQTGVSPRRSSLAS